MVLLEVEWVDGTPILYSDQELAGAEPLLLSIGGFDGSMQLTGSGDSQTMDVTLDDIEGELRTIYNTYDIHKRPARVYILGKGLPVTDRILVFRGEIVSPVSWDEANRSLSFSILTKLEEKQVGFSMEEGDFPNIPEEALGKAWPLVFGQVCHLPAVQVRAPRRGYLLRGEGIRDFTLDDRICQARQIQCPALQTGPQDQFQQEANDLWSKTILGTIGPDSDCAHRRYGEICKLLDLESQQAAYEHATMQIWNGASFPQGTAVTILVEDAKFHGSFSGNIFTVTGREHPDNATFNHIACQAVPDMGYGKAAADATALAGQLRAMDSMTPGTIVVQRGEQYQATEIFQADIDLMKINLKQRYAPDSEQDQLAYDAAVAQIDRMYPSPGWYAAGDGRAVSIDQAAIDGMKDKAYSTWFPDETGTYFKNSGALYPAQSVEDCDWTLFQQQGAVGGPRDSWWYYDRMESSSFFWAPAGTEVYLEGEEEIIYIASLISGSVDGVAAYKTAPNGKQYLTEVPTDYYSVWLQDYTGYYVIELHLDKMLSQVDDKWSDDLYVSFTSTVGPNPCDVIEWLVNKYTDLTIDATSFASVKSYLTNYPTNFYLLDRPDVYELINDIAFQSRCAVYVRNDVMYIRYLSVSPTAVRTINESDVLFGTFKESLSQTEDIITTQDITWQPAGASVQQSDPIERKVILKYNVDKYGTLKDDQTYYCHNTYQMVEKTGTFWLIRKANSWKEVEFKLPIRHIDLDVGDAIFLDIAQFAAPVKAVITSMQVDLEDNTISMTCWTPIRAGETTPYYWAWPSQQSAAQIWPLAGDTHGGGGYNFEVIPPVGHILTGGAHRDDQLVITTGELHPSDLDDTLPVVQCEVSENMEWSEPDPNIEAKEIAQSAARSGYATATSSGASGTSGGANSTNNSSNKPDDDGDCGTGAGCNYKATVLWHTSHSQGQATVHGGASPGGPCGGPCRCRGGCPSCFGKFWHVCHTFGSSWAARQFKAYMEGVYGTSATGDNSWWGCDETRVWQVSLSNGTLGAGCADISDTTSTDKTGETKKPVGETGEEATATGNQSKTALTISNVKADETAAIPNADATKRAEAFSAFLDSLNVTNSSTSNTDGVAPAV
jgi:hypothetical protein